jgi:hypothetical protein
MLNYLSKGIVSCPVAWLRYCHSWRLALDLCSRICEAQFGCLSSPRKGWAASSNDLGLSYLFVYSPLIKVAAKANSSFDLSADASEEEAESVTVGLAWLKRYNSTEQAHVVPAYSNQRPRFEWAGSNLADALPPRNSVSSFPPRNAPARLLHFHSDEVWAVLNFPLAILTLERICFSKGLA